MPRVLQGREGRPARLAPAPRALARASAVGRRTRGRHGGASLLLDLDVATVTVWVNGVRKGVMVRPGELQRLGPAMPKLHVVCC